MFGPSQKRKGGDICAVFVHAGAGYHSFENEALHLKACTDAAKAGMAVLRNSGSCLDAVEMAIRVLEDREITNAGYGSNLAMDGTVECDATIVDHLGRSGAVGAVSRKYNTILDLPRIPGMSGVYVANRSSVEIRNPISLARLVLEQTLTPLSLNRVAPNLLVGQGATDFAFEKRMAVHPHDALISPIARERWRRWKHDLMNAMIDQNDHMSSRYSEDAETAREYEYEERARQRSRKEHTQRMEQERLGARRHLSFSTPDSPASSFSLPTVEPPDSPGAPAHARQYSDSPTQFEGVRGMMGIGYGALADSPISPYNPSDRDQGLSYALSERSSQVDEEMLGAEESKGELSMIRIDGSSDMDSSLSGDSTLELPSASPSPPPFAALHTPLPPSPPGESRIYSSSPPVRADSGSVDGALSPPCSPVDMPAAMSSTEGSSEDRITDTVGAIAIDCWGNIAAGSSSGGIGMKHRGRIGPAALVGVGTAVTPTRRDDPHKMAVACVTSGTGEHMATTQAAARCAERVYNVGKPKGKNRVDMDENEAMKSMIEQDFMGHPSVTGSSTSGAIGVMAVKKTRDGVFLYFAHNTESFVSSETSLISDFEFYKLFADVLAKALASMHSEESNPVCVMSRGRNTGAVSLGGRAARYRRGQ
ncbi:MAG: hypothetical protein M1839_003430 [Geoglossum umbratile]|nr:MAG: hypothetical protein M1839_003430 [Geoglossum umbratile]